MAEKFQCPACGAGIDYDGSDTATVRCPYCNTSVVVPESLRPKRAKPEPVPVAPTVITLSTMNPSVNIGGGAVKTAGGCLLGTILVTTILPIVLVVGIGAAVWYAFQGAFPAEFGTDNPLSELGIEIPGQESSSSFATPLLSFGSEGTGPGNFEQAWTGGVDGDGNIYVGDYNGRIQVFDSNGTFLRQWTIEKDSLRVLTVSRDGTVYILDKGKINKYNGENGELLGTVEYQSANPLGNTTNANMFFNDIEVTPDGGLIALTDGDTVIRFNNQERVVLEIPQAIENVTGDSVGVAHVAEDGLGNIYVASQGDNSIFKFNPEGVYQQRFGSEGDEDGQFSGFIDGLAIDGQGRVYTADFSGIQVFDGDGRWEREISDQGTSVYDISVTPTNQLLAVSTTKIMTFQLP